MQIFRLRQGLIDYYEHSNPEYQNLEIDNVTRLTEGWQTLVFSFRINYVIEGGTISKDLIIRLYPGKEGLEKATNEFNILSSLMLTVVQIPDVFRFERNNEYIELPFIIMEYVEGPLLSNFINSNSDRREDLLQKFARILVDIHTIDWETVIHNSEKYAVSNPYRFIVNRMNDFKDKIEIHDKKEFIPVLRWLVERMDQVPNDKLSLLHNDFHLANIIVSDDEEFHTIDWMNSQIGDFRVDLAWTLVTHETVIDKYTRDVILNTYREYATYPVENIKYFEVMACLRRLLDLSINFTYGTEQSRLNPQTEDFQAIKNTLHLLYGHTGIKLPEFEQMLS